jgi:hypothetical protein
MEHITCILCDHESDRVVIEENGFQGRLCPLCNLIYISPRPSYAETLGRYSRNTARIPAETHLLESIYDRLHTRQMLRIIGRYKTTGSLLEIGPGGGHFLSEAGFHGYAVRGIELNPIQADHIRTDLGIPCDESPPHRSPFTGSRFDIIYHCDVLSHLYNPVEEFGTYREMLHDDGILIFETGIPGDPDGPYLTLFPTFQYPDHLFFFSDRSLLKLLKQTGFEPVRIYRYSVVPQLLYTRFSLSVWHGLASRFTARNNPPGRDATGTPSPPLSRRQERGAGSIRAFNELQAYLTYILRYRIGLISPKKGRPQTVIVVARKDRTGE